MVLTTRTGLVGGSARGNAGVARRVPKALACPPKPKRIPPRRRPARKHPSFTLLLRPLPSRTTPVLARTGFTFIVRAHHLGATAAPLPAGRAPSLPASICGTRTPRIGQLQPPSQSTAATSSQSKHGQSWCMEIVVTSLKQWLRYMKIKRRYELTPGLSPLARLSPNRRPSPCQSVHKRQKKCGLSSKPLPKPVYMKLASRRPRHRDQLTHKLARQSVGVGVPSRSSSSGFRRQCWQSRPLICRWMPGICFLRAASGGCGPPRRPAFSACTRPSRRSCTSAGHGWCGSRASCHTFRPCGTPWRSAGESCPTSNRHKRIGACRKSTCFKSSRVGDTWRLMEH